MPRKGDEMSSGGSQGGGDVFDVRRVRRLVELMNEYDLAEIDLRQSEQRIRLRKDVEPPAASAASVGSAVAGLIPGGGGYAASGPAPAPVAAAAPPPAAASAATDAKYVTSPMVGTFYASAAPDAPPFVKVGDHVGPETVVCIIEAMKVFNEIPAECSGKIAAMLVENGDAVEYGQKLFRVE